MTEIEKLEENLQSIFDKYKNDWLKFYDNINISEIVKRNNESYFKSIAEEMKIEMIKSYIKFKVDDKIKTNLAKNYFEEFDSLYPRY